MKTFLPFWRALLLAFGLGILLTFAFAPYEIFPFAIIMPAGLFALWINRPYKEAFFIGLAFGCGYFGAGVYWIYHSIHIIGEVPLWLSLIITGGFICLLSLFPATVGYVYRRFFTHSDKTGLIFGLPCLWVVSELARELLFTGFPWLLLGYSQTNSPLSGYAAIFSVYGVSLAVLLSSALLVNAWINYRQAAYKSLYYNILSLTCIWLIGALCTLIPWTVPNGKPLKVSLVQGNIAQEIKWVPEHLIKSLQQYSTLSEPLWGKSDLIIWPESAIPIPFEQIPDFINALNTKAIDTSTPLLLGIPESAGKENLYYNAILTLGKDNQSYYKRHLVPFGEYTPYKFLLGRLLDFMHIPMSNLTPGSFNQSPLKLKGFLIKPAICYEIAYSFLMHFDDRNIDMLLVVTNDGWFGLSNAQAQHLQIAQMRALEFKRPVIVVSNDGITGVINAQGKVQATLPAHQAGVLTTTVIAMRGTTPWMFNWTNLLMAILIIFFIVTWIANRRNAQRL